MSTTTNVYASSHSYLNARRWDSTSAADMAASLSALIDRDAGSLAGDAIVTALLLDRSGHSTVGVWLDIETLAMWTASAGCTDTRWTVESCATPSTLDEGLRCLSSIVASHRSCGHELVELSFGAWSDG